MKIKLNLNRDCIDDENVLCNKKIIINSKSKMKDLLQLVVNELPRSKNSVWAITNNNKVLEYINVDDDENIEKESLIDINESIEKVIKNKDIYSINYSDKDFNYINSKNKRVNLYSECKTLLEKVKKARKLITVSNI